MSHHNNLYCYHNRCGRVVNSCYMTRCSL